MPAKDIEVRIFETPEKLASSIAGMISLLTRKHEKMPVHVAISGGRTPGVLFETMAGNFRDKTEWPYIHFWWCDERCVAPDSPDSNYGQAMKTLFSKVSIPEGNLHRIVGEADPEEEAERYGLEIAGNLNSNYHWPVFDLVILGMGEDGHIASLFPDQLQLLNSPKICTVTSHPLTGQKRITLTGKVFNNARRVLIMVTGEGKSHRISEIMNNRKTARKLPAYYIDPGNGKLEWFLDAGAASLI